MSLPNKNVADIKNVESEAGVIATLCYHPEFSFYSEQLKPNHFSDEQNAYFYYGICELAKRGVETIDAYNLFNILNANAATRKAVENISIQSITDMLSVSKCIARDTVEEYKVLVGNVMDAAFRRHTYENLVKCERLCFNANEKDIEHQIYSALDGVMMEFSSVNDVPQYKDVVDQYWSDILARRDPQSSGAIPFKFPHLNNYVLIERGELVIFGAEQKMGKSMLLLNCAVDLLRKGYRVLYLDSELNSRLFTCRMISHLTGIEFRRVRSGQYTEEEGSRINEAIAWLKTRTFTHLYMPTFDEQSVYTVVKKVYYQTGVDVSIIDYFKGGSDEDAFATYQGLGSLVDMVKNQICGNMNIAAIGAAQATATGKLADSAKIARNASTIIMLQDKSQDEIEADGQACGNKKLFVRFNRNGPQMSEGEYIDMVFDGDHISYEEAQQHMQQLPY